MIEKNERIARLYAEWPKKPAITPRLPDEDFISYCDRKQAAERTYTEATANHTDGLNIFDLIHATPDFDERSRKFEMVRRSLSLEPDRDRKI